MANGKWWVGLTYSPFTINHPLNLYLQNLPDNQHASELHAARGVEQVVAARVAPEHGHVVGVHDGDGQRDEDGQAAEYPRRHPRAGRQRVQVFEDAEAVADGRGDLLQNLREVPARLALDHDGRDAEAQV